MTLAGAVMWAANAVLILALPLRAWSLFTGDEERRHLSSGLYAVGNWLAFLANVMDGSHGWAAFFGVLAAYFTWEWWRRRKGRGRRALRELGAKSRARIEAMVRNMTPSPIPSPAGG